MLLLSYVPFLKSQTIHPLVTPQQVLPFGPYPNVQNTGAFLAPVEAGTKSPLRSAFCWDGDEPGIAVVEHDNLSVDIASLPQNINDPDIVFGVGASKGVVTYEVSGQIVYQTFTYSNGNISLGNMVPLAAGTHPNIDKQHDCEEFTEEAVIVYENPSQEIFYSEGNLGGNFGTPIIVPSINNSYATRIRPDVAFLGKSAPPTFVFSFIGTDNNGDHFVDNDRDIKVNPPIPFINRRQISNIPNTHPRIDGVLDGNYSSSIAYYYQVTYHEGSTIWEANNGQNITDLSTITSVNELPAVAYSGDFSDIIYTTNEVGGLELLGKEYVQGNAASGFKQLASTTGCSSTNLYPSIDGHCGPPEEVITFWYDGSCNALKFKFAKTQGAPNDKRGGGSAAGEAPSLLPEFIQKGSFEMPEYAMDRSVEVFNTAGQLGLESSLSQFKEDLSLVQPGSYVLIIGEGENQSVQNMILQ